MTLGLNSAPDVTNQTILSSSHFDRNEFGKCSFVIDENLIKSLGTDAESNTHAAEQIHFQLRLTNSLSVHWDTLVCGKIMYVMIPAGVLPDGSKESFVSLLEYAEEVMECSQVIICLDKNRKDRAALVRMFMFLGFTSLPPSAVIPPNSAPQSADLLYLLYSIE